MLGVACLPGLAIVSTPCPTPVSRPVWVFHTKVFRPRFTGRSTDEIDSVLLLEFYRDVLLNHLIRCIRVYYVP